MIVKIQNYWIDLTMVSRISDIEYWAYDKDNIRLPSPLSSFIFTIAILNIKDLIIPISPPIDTAYQYAILSSSKEKLSYTPYIPPDHPFKLGYDRLIGLWTNDKEVIPEIKFI